MGFLSGLLGPIGSVAGGLFGGPAGAAIGGALGGALGGSGASQSGTATTTQQQQLDPRIQQMLFGQNGSGGLLSQYQGMLGKPQNAGIAAFGNSQDGYLGQTAIDDLNHLRAASYNQIDHPITAPGMQAAQVNAPGQNKMDLSGSYNSLINGAPGANPYLTAGIQGGINQSQNQFNQMQRQATDNLQRNVLGGIRSNSVLAGQYGGSRQGVAEGNAISDFTQQQQNAINQFGQNNTNAAVNAQSAAYDADRNRQLAATQGLSGQQYGVAQQDAAARQNADQTNINALMATHGLNAAAQQNGMNNLNGLIGNAYTAGQNQDGYALSQAGKVNGLLAPYLGANSSSTTSQPLYENKAGNALGGAMFGSQLFGGGGGKGLLGDIGSLFGPGTIGAGI